ncbi:MAG: D-alanine--D-alanine ligase, partial [Deinococcales bacterium]
QLHIPANISPELAQQCQDLAIKAFEAIDAAGLARMDFFYDELSQQLYLNEINTMPGFTKTSMYPKLWQASGIGYQELIHRLVHLALEKR